DQAASTSVTVDYLSDDGSAEEGLDYEEAEGTLTIAAGQTSASFAVAVIDDSLIEPTETVYLTLSDPVGASLGTPGSATLSILDNDLPRVKFSASSYSAQETDHSATISVVLSEAASTSVTVHYQTGDDTAKADVDYQETSGTLTIAAGQTSG